MTNAVADPTIHVVAGILSDAEGRVLFAERAAGTHLAGLWEFPGGKIEPGESVESALRRELHEELGVEIGATEPLISIPWRYPQKAIVLHTLRVRDFLGEPRGRQGQNVRWLHPDEASQLPMPPPDRPIVSALRLPDVYAITPEPGDDAGAFLSGIEYLLAGGVRLIQLRAKRTSPDRLRALAGSALELTRRAGATLLLNGHVDLVGELGLDGVHLPAAELVRLRERPLGTNRWVAASCHDANEIARAWAIGVDFAVLGPVSVTQSHSDAPALGWERFAAVCATAPFPVYALGGLVRSDVVVAKAAGSRGIAGVSAFWPGSAAKQRGS